MVEPEDSDGPSRPWVRVVLFIESILFPLAFLGLTADTVRKLLAPLERPTFGEETTLGVAGALVGFITHPDTMPRGVPPEQLYALFGMIAVRPALLILFNLMCAGFIALRFRLRYRPTSPSEVVVPFLATTLFLLIPLSERLAPWISRPVSYPASWAFGLYATATGLGILGGLVAIYGLVYLRRNFSVFVEVREVVLGGPYRFIRHPLYAGEIIEVTGITLTLLSPATIVFWLLLIILQTMRARMEERRLAEASPAYVKLLSRTGMFFPRFRGLVGRGG